MKQFWKTDLPSKHKKTLHISLKFGTYLLVNEITMQECIYLRQQFYAKHNYIELIIVKIAACIFP